MNNIIFAALMITFAATCAKAEEIMEVKTNPVVVSATRTPSLYSEISRIVTVIPFEQIQNAPVKNIEELLEYSASVDVRRRGGPSAQADYSIRGGTFDQALILLNGIPFNSPQTGHHSGNIPVSINDIERIEILEGSGGRVLGNNAFSGGINIITKKDANAGSINIAASGGQYGFYDYNLSAFANPFDNVRTYYSFYKQKNDGYMENTDTDVINLYGYNAIDTRAGEFALQFGFNNREFGANSFYTSLYPDQFEETKASFISLSHNKVFADFDVSSRFYYNIHLDRFELFRDMKNIPSWYSKHNYHRTDVWGAEAKTSFTNFLGRSSVGIDYRREEILSNVLGDKLSTPVKVKNEKDIYYTNFGERDNVSMFLEHNSNIGKFNFSMGAMLNWNSVFDTDIYSGIDVSYSFNDASAVFASINRSGRLPTFTDLYYEGPTNKGNPNLKPEYTLSYEAGIKHINELVNTSFSVFHNRGTDLIDWIRQSDTTVWQTMNLTNVNSTGFQTSLNIYPAIYFENIKFIALSYTFIDSEKESEKMLSRYALDFLRHKFTFRVGIDLSHGFGSDIGLNYQRRDGTYYHHKTSSEEPYDEILLVSARIHYKISSLNIYLDADNIFDKKYQDIANIIQPGRWVRLGFDYSLSKNGK